MNRALIPALILASLTLLSNPEHAIAQGGCCVLPDNGNGTVDMPPLCSYFGPLLIDDGIPNGTIEIAAVIGNYFNTSEIAGGGALGGSAAFFDGTVQLNMTGTGTLAGLNRVIFLPVTNSEFHFAPRTTGAPVQNYAGDVWRLTGQIFGDPDFDTILLQAGTSLGFPSPGQTKLTVLGPAGAPFSVDSFFDIHYSMSFSGAPGSILQNLAGTTLSNGLFELCPGIATGVQGAPESVESTWGDVKLLFR